MIGTEALTDVAASAIVAANRQTGNNLSYDDALGLELADLIVPALAVEKLTIVLPDSPFDGRLPPSITRFRCTSPIDDD